MEYEKDYAWRVLDQERKYLQERRNALGVSDVVKGWIDNHLESVMDAMFYIKQAYKEQ